MNLDFLEDRPIVVALGGPNGAGKTTFYHAFLRDTGLPFLNADDLARAEAIDAYAAAKVLAQRRDIAVQQGDSFVFETVLSDPVAEKVRWLAATARRGYQVALIYIDIPDPRTSVERVAMRVSQGGHDVPAEKLHARFPRTRKNLAIARFILPHVLIYDNGDLSRPYRLVAAYAHGVRQQVSPSS